VGSLLAKRAADRRFQRSDGFVIGVNRADMVSLGLLNGGLRVRLNPAKKVKNRRPYAVPDSTVST
jgi:hypothetical protein